MREELRRPSRVTRATVTHLVRVRALLLLIETNTQLLERERDLVDGLAQAPISLVVVVEVLLVALTLPQIADHLVITAQKKETVRKLFN